MAKKKSAEKEALKAAPEKARKIKDSSKKTKVKSTAPKKAAAPKRKKKSPVVPTTEEIALRAYYIAERRQRMGWAGDSHSDWIEAERQLLQEAADK